MNTTHVEAARHAMSGHISPKKISHSVALFGPYTVQFLGEFSGLVVFEKSNDGVQWAPVETFNGDTLVSMTYKRAESQAGYQFRFNGAQLRSLIQFRLFDGEQ